MDLDAFMDMLNPLDIILVQGTSPFSKLIQSGSSVMRGNGQFSHCGMVINKDICPSINVPDNRLLFLESSVNIYDETLDIETGEFSLGTQIRDLRLVLKECLKNGIGIASCPLKNNPYLEAKTEDDKKIIRDAISNIHKNYFVERKSLYELNIFSLLGTIFPSVRQTRDNVDKIFSFVTENHPWMFCTEIICLIYQNIGIVEKNIDIQAYLPVDFVHPGKDNILHSIMKLPPVFLKEINTRSIVWQNCFKFFFLRRTRS
jgi:hypothetical protein